MNEIGITPFEISGLISFIHFGLRILIFKSLKYNFEIKKEQNANCLFFYLLVRKGAKEWRPYPVSGYLGKSTAFGYGQVV